MSLHVTAAPDFVPDGTPNNVRDFFGASAPSRPRVPYSKVVVENARRTSPTLTVSMGPEPVNAPSFLCLSAFPLGSISATTTWPEFLSISKAIPTGLGISTLSMREGCAARGGWGRIREKRNRRGEQGDTPTSTMKSAVPAVFAVATDGMCLNGVMAISPLSHCLSRSPLPRACCSPDISPDISPIIPSFSPSRRRSRVHTRLSGPFVQVMTSLVLLVCCDPMSTSNVHPFRVNFCGAHSRFSITSILPEFQRTTFPVTTGFSSTPSRRLTHAPCSG
mmetsp:Transcript_11030/g.21904  ORF Transcript_11030/g.21904 Transcript_11030/m.21904 type:complete len:277 (-) Transcript_11030:252-1082(-)